MSYVYKKPTTKFDKFMEACFGKKCPCCGWHGLADKQCYNRGYNSWCEQAAGDFGLWCQNCVQVIWLKTDDEYEQQSLALTPWCIPTHRYREWMAGGCDDTLLTKLGYQIIFPLPRPYAIRRVGGVVRISK